MFKITNNSTTHIAIENANLAPRQSTIIAMISEGLHYLEHKGAVKIEPVIELSKPIEIVAPVIYQAPVEIKTSVVEEIETKVAVAPFKKSTFGSRKEKK